MRAAGRALLRLALALAVSSAGCVASPEAASEIGAITMGTETAGDPAVVALVPLETPREARCSATLVAPRVLVTAAHCELEAAPTAWEAVFGSSLTEGGTRIPVLHALPHPAFDGDADDDLELVLLAEPAPVEPVTLASTPPGMPPLPARLVGFGFTGPDANDSDRKREGETSIADVEPLHVVLAPSPSLPCSGDSGGPLLVGAPGEEVLAGVVSRGDPACASVARATRIDAHLTDFLVPTLEAWAEGSRADGEGCVYDAQCRRGACLTAADEPLVRYCGGACAGDADCEAPLRCEAGACRYLLPSPGAFGAACSDDADCARGECVESEGYCSVRCAPSRDECPASSACTHLGSIDFFCVPTAPGPSCGCRVAPRSLGTLRLVAVTLVVLALRVRARSRRRRAERSGPRLR
jgi:hypothetical protein